jgi:hypothetical protein
VLPDGLIGDVVRPTFGRVSGIGETVTGVEDRYVVENGTFTAQLSPAPTSVVYFTIELPDPRRKVQHIWWEADVASSWTGLGGVTFISNTNAGGIQSGLHWVFSFDSSNGHIGKLASGGYNAPGVAAGVTRQLTANSILGSRVRIDIVYDIKTGLTRGYIDTIQVMQFQDSVIGSYIAGNAIFEVNGREFFTRRFGCSAHLPDFALSESSSMLTMANNGFFGNTTLNNTAFERLGLFPVTYGSSGAIVVEWNPFVNVTSGTVYFGLGTSDINGNSAVFPAQGDTANSWRIAEAGTNCRVPVRMIRYGAPGSSEYLNVCARVSAGGAGTIRNSDYGAGGPTWRPFYFQL